MPLPPDLSFRDYQNGFGILSAVNFIQSKAGSGALPVLMGEESNPVLFRIYNNFALNMGIEPALNVAITTYDGLGIGSHTANTLPVSQSWLHVLEHGFGQNSTILKDLYTRFDGIDTAVGGSNKYYAQKGSDGSYGVSDIFAGNPMNGAGYIEYKSYCTVPEGTPGDLYAFVISVSYEYTT